MNRRSPFMPDTQRVGITGVILAGGRGTRMGGVEKGLLDWLGRPLIARLIEDLAPQVDRLLINANRAHERYAAFGLPLIADDPRHAGLGPLAGVHAALTAVETGRVVCVPCDLPGLPEDLVSRFLAASTGQGAPLVMAATGARLHPTVCLVDASFRSALQDSLQRGEHAAWRWFAAHRVRLVDFGASGPLARNLNTPGDLAALGMTAGRSSEG